MILSRAPLTEQAPRVRLACIRHAASVRPEPGSNSSLYGVERARTRIRTRRNGSGTCASSRFSCEGTVCRLDGSRANKKPGVSRRDRAADTWRRLWPHGQRVSQVKKAGPRTELLRLPTSGETTVRTTKRSIARQRHAVKSRCGRVRRCAAPSMPGWSCATRATIPRRVAPVKLLSRTKRAGGLCPADGQGQLFSA